MALPRAVTPVAFRLRSLGPREDTRKAFLTLSNEVLLGCLRQLSRRAQHNLLVVHSREKPEAHLQEALRLAETFSGRRCPHVLVGSARNFWPSPATYFGSGVVAEVATKAATVQADRIFVNVELSGVQQRNLEIALARPVLDRVKLIIDIFGQRAQTREAKLQVEMASLQLRSTRLVRGIDTQTGHRAGFGEKSSSEVVSARQRGRSGSTAGGLGGAAGAGESELQLQRRQIRSRIRALKQQLSDVQKSRAVQRASRQRQGVPTIAVVGYTNAGKSSLVSSLSQQHISIQDRLFETLDTTTRRVMLPSGRDALFTDTVGFISNLPLQLIKAFKATLEEVQHADLLLHVMDASSPNLAQQRIAVLEVLKQLGISQTALQSNVIEVWNKADVLEPPEADAQSDLAYEAASDVNSSHDSDSADMGYVSDSEREGPAPSSAGVPPELGELDQADVHSMQAGVQDGLDLAATVNTFADSASDDSDSPHHVTAAQSTGWPASSSPPHTEGHAAPSSPQAVDVEAMAASVAERYEPTALHDSPSADADADAEADDTPTLQRLQQQVAAHMSRARVPPALHAFPTAVLTSAETGLGLPELLLEIDRKVAIKCATEEVKAGLARMGPRMLIEGMVGPAFPQSVFRQMWRNAPRTLEASHKHVRRRPAL